MRVNSRVKVLVNKIKHKIRKYDLNVIEAP